MMLSYRLGRSVKSALAHTLFETGLTRRAFGLLRRLDSKRRVIVVVYHKVFPAERGEQLDGMAPEIFRDQIRALKGLFDVVSAEAAVAAMEDPAGPRTGSYPLLVTFDDGFANNVEYAVPILQRYSIPGLFFVTTRLVGTSGFLWTDEVRDLILGSPLQELRLFPGTGREETLPLPDRSARLEAASRLKARLKLLGVAEFEGLLEEIRRAAQVDALEHHVGTRMLTWREVERMAACGMTIGSHSGRHIAVTRLSVEELDTELQYSRQAIEQHLGEAPRFFAYPNGHPEDFDHRTAAQLSRAGFTHAFTMTRGIAKEGDDPLMLPRYCPSNVAGALVAFELLQTLVGELVSERWHARARRRSANVIPLHGTRGREAGPPSSWRAAG